MKYFASLIREGLKTGIQEDCEIFTGIVDEGSGLKSNVIGIALAGKIGLQCAQKIFAAAIQESHEGGSATEEMIQLLGITYEQMENLTAVHLQMTAEQIAAEIEDGSYIWEPACCREPLPVPVRSGLRVV